MPRRRAAISGQLRKLGRRLSQFRQSHPPRTRLPEQFWQAATSLVRREGLYRTARTLHLDYANLKKRVEMSSLKRQTLQKTSGLNYSQRSHGNRTRTSKPTRTPSSRLTNHNSRRRTAPIGFVEMLADSIAADCLIEVEEAGGARLRIQMKMSGPEVLSLVREWRDRSAAAGRENNG